MFSQSESKKSFTHQENAQKLKEYLQLNDKEFSLVNNAKVSSTWTSHLMSTDEAEALHKSLKEKLTTLDPFNDQAIQMTTVAKSSKNAREVYRLDIAIKKLEAKLHESTEEEAKEALRAQIAHTQLLKNDLLNCFVEVTVSKVKSIDRLVFEPFQVENRFKLKQLY